MPIIVSSIFYINLGKLFVLGWGGSLLTEIVRFWRSILHFSSSEEPCSNWHLPRATFSSLYGFGLGFFSELLFVSRLSLVVIVGWIFSTLLVTFRASGWVSRVCGNSISPFVAPVVEPFFFVLEVDFSTEFRLVEAGFGLSLMASMRLRRCGTHVAVTPVVTKMQVRKFLHLMVPTRSIEV